MAVSYWICQAAASFWFGSAPSPVCTLSSNTERSVNDGFVADPE
jgi:hypothetical protein